MIDAACSGWGCDETILIEVFVMHTQVAARRRRLDHDLDIAPPTARRASRRPPP